MGFSHQITSGFASEWTASTTLVVVEIRRRTDRDDVQILDSEHRLVADVPPFLGDVPRLAELREFPLVDVRDGDEFYLLRFAVPAGVTRFDLLSAYLVLVVHSEDAHPRDSAGTDDSRLERHYS